MYRGDGLNLYAYCENNPVIYYDPSGINQKICYQMSCHQDYIKHCLIQLKNLVNLN